MCYQKHWGHVGKAGMTCRSCSMMQFIVYCCVSTVDPFVHSGLKPLTVQLSNVRVRIKDHYICLCYQQGKMLWWEKEINCLQEMILQLFFLAVIMTWHCDVFIFTITEWCAVIFGLPQIQNIWDPDSHSEKKLVGKCVWTAPLFKWASGNLHFEGCKSATAYILNIYITRIVCYWCW